METWRWDSLGKDGVECVNGEKKDKGGYGVASVAQDLCLAGLSHTFGLLACSKKEDWKEEHTRGSRKHRGGAPGQPTFNAEFRAVLGSQGGFMTTCDRALAIATGCKPKGPGMQGGYCVPRKPSP